MPSVMSEGGSEEEEEFNLLPARPGLQQLSEGAHEVVAECGQQFVTHVGNGSSEASRLADEGRGADEAQESRVEGPRRRLPGAKVCVCRER